MSPVHVLLLPDCDRTMFQMTGRVSEDRQLLDRTVLNHLCESRRVGRGGGAVLPSLHLRIPGRERSKDGAALAERERESVGRILFVAAASFIPGCDLREEEAEGPSVRASEAVFQEQTAGMVASSEEREPERPAAARRTRIRCPKLEGWRDRRSCGLCVGLGRQQTSVRELPPICKARNRESMIA